MKICGVIAEYNPFHNGHKYHLDEARKLSRCDYLIVVMDGSFSQRGEIMLLDKWTRTRMALENGADLVVELPALFAVQSADRFARGGVKLLAGLGADSICFGCETDDFHLLNRLLDTLSQEDDELKKEIREGLIQGKSQVRARAEAAAKRMDLPTAFIFRPNTVLALEYMRSNRTLNRPMDIHIVRRTADYHASAIGSITSASAIRSAISREETDLIRMAVPENVWTLIQSRQSGGLADMSRLDSLLIDRMRSLGPSGIAELADVGEGLENRAIRCAEAVGSRPAFLDLIKCKRYTYARLSRLCAHAMLGITKELYLRHPEPEYARILGFRRDSSALMTCLKNVPFRIVARASDLKGDEMFHIERRATDLQSLCFSDERLRSAGRDLTEKIVIV